MKMLIVTLGLLMSFVSFAETPEVWGRDVTCQELKATLANYGAVKVKSKFIGIRTSMTVYDKVDCRFHETERVGVFGTKDIRNCHVGRFCDRDIEHFPREHFPRCGGRLCLEN